MERAPVGVEKVLSRGPHRSLLLSSHLWFLERKQSPRYQARVGRRGNQTTEAEFWVGYARSPKAENCRQVKDWEPGHTQLTIPRHQSGSPGRGRFLHPGSREGFPVSHFPPTPWVARSALVLLEYTPKLLRGGSRVRGYPLASVCAD